MALGCGSKLAKYFLVLFNILLSLMGIVLIASGIYVLVIINQSINNGSLYGVQFGVLKASAGIIIGVGSAIVLLCWLGCCGAVKENTGCLTCYAVFVFILAIIQLVAFIMCVTFYTQINSGLHDTMMNTLVNNYSTNDTAPATSTWDAMQKNFHCCGVESSSDWKSSEWKKQTQKNVPASCCVLNSTSNLPLDEKFCQLFAYNITANPFASKYVYQSGCLQKVQDAAKPALIWFICITLAIILIQVFVGIIACCLKSSIKNTYEKV